MKKIMYLTFALLLGSIRLDAAQSAQDIYKEALMQEMTVRDLPAAVSLYEKVATDNSAPRNIRAQAYLRLGLCQKVLGKSREAAAAWENVTTNFSDQPNEHREALMHRQALEMEERPVERVVVSSTIVKVVHELNSTRVEWEILRLQSLGHSTDLSRPSHIGTYPLINSLAYYYRPNMALGVRYLTLFDIDPFNIGVQNSIQHAGVFWKVEQPVARALRPFFALGVGGYRVKSSKQEYVITSGGDAFSSFTYTSLETLPAHKYWTTGMNAAAGLTLGLSQGFTLNLGYDVHLMARKTPSADVQNWDGTFEHAKGYRLLHGPHFSLSYRW